MTTERPSSIPASPATPAREPWLLGSAAAFRRDPLAFLSALDRDRGPSAPFRLGRARWCLVTHPRDVEAVLTSSDGSYRKPPAITARGRLFFGGALTATDGATWRARRARSAAAFQPRRFPEHAPSIVAHTAALSGTWRDGEPVDATAGLQDACLRIAVSSLAGEAVAETGELRASIETALRGYAAAVEAPLALPAWLPVASHRAMRRGMSTLRAFVGGLVASRGREPAARPGLIDALLRPDAGGTLPAHVVRDELAIMLSLGAHQTALAMAWTLHAVSVHRDVQAELHAEIDAHPVESLPALADAGALRYTGHVVDETLRLYPPFFLLVRETTRDVTLGRVAVPRGTTVALSPFVTQRSERYFEDAERFSPERWTDGCRQRVEGTAYFPFGGGPRTCIASGLVRRQLVLMTALLAGRWWIEPAPGCEVEPRPKIALAMRNPLRLVPRLWRGS